MIRSSLLRGRNRTIGLGAVVAAAWLLFGASPASAQQGAVTGTVTDAQSGEPISGAQVFVRGTNLGTLTNQDGSYRLTGVPTGQQTVRVRLIGYKRASQTVQVAAGQAATADFQLTQTALELQEVVVTGVAAETPKVKLPFTVESIDSEKLEVPASDVSGILQGKMAGVTITSASGQPGGSSDILLRGQSSINAAGRDQGPLIVIDGVIQSTDASLADINSLDIKNVEVVKGAAAASMYGSRAQNGVIQITTKSGADLQGQEEQFDITLRSEVGKNSLENQWPAADFHAMQMNESQTAFLNGSGEETDFGVGGDLQAESACSAGAPRCFQDNPYPTQRDPFGTFFDPGETVSLYGAIAGATGETNIRVSGEWYQEEGTISVNEGFERVNGRFNLNHSVGEDFDISGTAFVSRSENDPVIGNGQAGGALFGMMFMSPGADVDQKRVAGRAQNDECTGGPEDDCWFVILPDQTAASDRNNPFYLEQANVNNSEKKRLMGSAQATWSPISWFSLDGTFSFDRTDDNSDFFVRKGTPQDDGGRSLGFLQRTDFVQEAINASVTANLNKSFMDGDLVARLRGRYLIEDQETKNFNADGSDLVTGNVRSLNAARDNSTFSIGSNFTNIKSQNLFAIASLDLKDRYIIDGLIRRDGSSLFGPEERWQTYFRASGAYRLSEEPWFDVPAVDNLKLRYSIGTAGSRPTFSMQYETFTIGGGSLGFATLGNPELKPELSTEQEVGFDLALLDRVQISGTYAEQETEDQILPVPQPAAAGFGTRWANAGTLVSETWEGSIEGTFVQQQDVTWSATLTAHTTSETITEMNVTPFRYGPNTQGGDVFFARPGQDIGTFFGFDFIRSCADLESRFGIGQSRCQAEFDVNDHGYLVYVGEGNTFRDGAGPDGELGTSDDLWGTLGFKTVGNEFEWGQPLIAERVDPLCVENNPDAPEQVCKRRFQPVGNSNADVNMSFTNTLNVKGFQIYTLLDATLGFDVYNGTTQWSMAPKTRGVGTAYKGSDAVNMPDGLKKPLAYYNAWTYQGNAVNDFFVEDGSFLKLREVSVSYDVPGSLLSSIPWAGQTFDAATVSVLGRNLLTFTDYRGFDPEVGFGNSTGATGATGSASNARFARFQYPNFRTISAAVELTF